MLLKTLVIITQELKKNNNKGKYRNLSQNIVIIPVFSHYSCIFSSFFKRNLNFCAQSCFFRIEQLENERYGRQLYFND